MTTHPALIVVADEHSARFFVRKSKASPIVERIDYAESSDLLQHGEQRPGGIIRVGGRARTKPRSMRSQEELEIFLRRVASRIDEATDMEGITGLAIVAPPQVMSGLRDFIAPSTRARIVHESCRGIASKTLSEIDSAMLLANV